MAGRPGARGGSGGATLGASALALTAFFSAPAHAAQDATCGVLAPGASATAQAAVDAACSQIGVWYSWGGGHAATPGASYGFYDGSDPDSLHDGERKGFDCSGLMRYAYYRATGKDLLNGTAADQFHTPQASARFSAGQGTAPLLPGDLIFTGTPSGVGYSRTPARYLTPGSIVHSAIEGLGRLRNPCTTAG